MNALPRESHAKDIVEAVRTKCRRSFRLVPCIVILLCLPGWAGLGHAAEEMMVVVSATARIAAGDKLLATVPRGTKLWSFSQRGTWHQVKVPDAEQRGWIHARDVRKMQLSSSQLQQYNRGNTLWQQGEELANNGKVQQALKLLLKSLPDIRSVAGEHHPNTASLLHSIAFKYEALQKLKDAASYYEQALKAYQQTLGPTDSRCANTLYNLGGVYGQLSNIANTVDGEIRLNDRCLKCLRHTLAIAERDGNVALAARALNDIGFNQTDVRQAEASLLKSMSIKKRLYGEVNEHVVTALQNLGDRCGSAGDYLKGVHYYLRALEIERQLYPDEPSKLTWSTRMVGVTYEKLRDFEKAEQYHLEYVALKEREGKTAWIDLGIFYRNSGQYPKAEQSFIRAYEIAFRPDALVHLSRLDILNRKTQNYPAAERRLSSRLQKHEQQFGQHHYQLSEDLLDLGTLYAHTNRFEEAESYFSRSLDIARRTRGDAHPDVADRLRRRGLMRIRKGDVGAGLDDFGQSRQTIRRHVTKLLPQMDAIDQLRFLEEGDRDPFFQALSVGRQFPDDPDAVQASAEWLINGKAVTIESLARQSVLTRLASSDQAQRLVQMLNRTRNQLATESLRLPEPDHTDAHAEKLEKLRNREQEIGRELGISLNIRDENDTWVELETVRKRLPADSVLVDILRLRPFDFHNESWQPEHYVAWIIPPAGPQNIRMLDLGAATTIDAQIVRCRKSIEDAPREIQDSGEAIAASEAQKVLTSLAEHLLIPVLPEINNAKQLIISPDSQLWLVPWAALPIQPDRFLVEDCAIRFVATGRDVLAKPPVAGKQNSALLIADPDFDLVVEREQNDDQPNRSIGGERLLIPSVRRLPGTAAEAEAVRPNVRQLIGSEPTVLTGKGASESAVKQLRRPAMAIFSTHGFFLQDQPNDVATNENVAFAGTVADADRDSTGGSQPNPLLRCGLLLAGCNHRSPSEIDADDGVLTGLEIVGIDFRATELVVLSACETGVGDVQNGEGVAGLRQAFQQAGAQTVVSTLWQIADEETARLMNEFFQNLAGGHNKSEALRQAQLTRIKARRQRHGAAHPFFWAAFTMTGMD